MRERISQFFTESGQVFLNPDDLFYYKTEEKDNNGIISLLFYNIMLALVMGIATGSIELTAILVLFAIIVPTICMLIHSIFVFIFAKLLGGNGSFINTFNLLSYNAVLNVVLMAAITLTLINGFVIVPALLLVYLWKIVLEIIAVSEEHNIGYAKAFLSTKGISLILFILVILILGLI